jgi:hypothetical protein
MAKKQKFTPDNEQPTTDAPATEANTEAKAPLIPRNPSLFLQSVATGTQFKFDRRALPKKAAHIEGLTIDGEAKTYQVTSNKGWADSPEHTLEYIWTVTPSGVEGYITLDYAQSAADFLAAQGSDFTVGEGKANRDNPSRIGVADREAGRIAKFQETYAARKAAPATTEGEPAVEGEAAAQ